ncbi:hypothetical protein QTP86_009564 [Hemibagrus guttatus]|nr:hypothetical protein QTP86_009564 [Hemibagrus guttatus]
MWSGVVWGGVVWCGGDVVWVWSGWCGVEWSGVVWSDVMWGWSGVEWSGVVWSGVVWCGVEWCGVDLTSTPFTTHALFDIQVMNRFPTLISKMKFHMDMNANYIECVKQYDIAPIYSLVHMLQTHISSQCDFLNVIIERRNGQNSRATLGDVQCASSAST